VSKIDFRSLFQSNIPSERNPTSDSLVYNTGTGTHVLAGPTKHRIAAINVDGIAPWPKLPPLPLRVHSSKVELAAAGVHPVGMISSHASI